MSRVRYFRYGVAARSDETQHAPRLLGHHGHYGGLVEIKKKKRRRPEDAIQKAIVSLLTFYRNQGRLIFFAVPNGERRDKLTAAILKSLGVVAGAPDLVVLPNDGPTILIEVKADDGRQSPSQKEFEVKARRFGHRYHVVRSVDECDAIIKKALRCE